MKTPFVSIIVPVSKRNSNLDECIRYCLMLDYPDYEIVVLPDESFPSPDKLVKVIATGHMGPARKRNIGFHQAKGEIIAFIDDDTDPEKDWLKNAISNFTDSDVAAVGGPAVTPASDSLWQQASGGVYSSLLGGGSYRYRYIPLQKRLVDDFPSCNLIVRKEVLVALGGFQTDFWPGEDTHLCLDIVTKLNKKIVYEPGALIYHHRRSLFRGHMKQINAYALHRGYFAKRFPKTSLRLSYFLPTGLVLFICFGWLVCKWLYVVGVLFYLSVVVASVIPFKGIMLKLLIFLGIIGTHISYGVFFIKGLLSKRLKEE